MLKRGNFLGFSTVFHHFQSILPCHRHFFISPAILFPTFLCSFKKRRQTIYGQFIDLTITSFQYLVGYPFCLITSLILDGIELQSFPMYSSLSSLHAFITSFLSCLIVLVGLLSRICLILEKRFSMGITSGELPGMTFDFTFSP